MRRLWIAVALLAFGYTLLPTIPASAGYGAIAWDKGTGKSGVSWNQPTGKRAEDNDLVSLRHGCDACDTTANG